MTDAGAARCSCALPPHRGGHSQLCLCFRASPSASVVGRLASAVGVPACDSASLAAVLAALGDGSISAIETDLVWSESQSAVVHAHPPATASDLPFDAFLDAVCGEDARPAHVKLDFKMPNIVAPCVASIDKYYADALLEKQMALWLNADVLPGPGAPRCAFDADAFCRTYDFATPVVDALVDDSHVPLYEDCLAPATHWDARRVAAGQRRLYGAAACAAPFRNGERDARAKADAADLARYLDLAI